MDRQKILGKEPIHKLLLQYSIPAIIGMLVNALYNVVDRIFIGKIPDIGPLALTGVGVTMPIMTMILGVSMLVGIGATASISLTLGSGNRKDGETILGNATVLMIIMGIILTVIGLLLRNKILMLFGASENTLYYATEYINIILIGTVFSISSFALNATIRADGNPKMAAATMILGCVVNIIFDYIFIFIFNLGIKGAAIATVLAQIITTVVIIYYYTKGSSNLKLKIENLKLDAKIVKRIFAIGFAPFAMQIAASAVQIVSNNSLRTYGNDFAIGAMTVISSVSLIFLMPIFGINQGSQPIIGYNYGAKEYKRAKLTLKYAIIVATIIVCIGAVVIQVFPETVISIFNSDESLLKIGVTGIRIYLFMLPLIGFQIVGSNYFQSIGKVKIATFLSLLRQVILLIPFTLILPRVFGVNGVWLAGAFSDFIASIITGVFIIREFRRVEN